MKLKTAILAYLLTVGIIGATGTHADEAADNQRTSFDRAFNHKPATAPAPNRDDIDTDVLYELVSKTLQSSAGESPSAASNESGDDQQDTSAGGE